jgi:hypothetical protein
VIVGLALVIVPNVTNQAKLQIVVMTSVPLKSVANVPTSIVKANIKAALLMMVMAKVNVTLLMTYLAVHHLVEITTVKVVATVKDVPILVGVLIAVAVMIVAKVALVMAHGAVRIVKNRPAQTVAHNVMVLRGVQ